MDLESGPTYFFFLTFQIGSVCDEEFKKIFFAFRGPICWLVCGSARDVLEVSRYGIHMWGVG